MGLAEKKAIHDFQTTQWPAMLQRMQTAAGYNLEVVPLWDTLVPHEKNVAKYAYYFEQFFVLPIENCFKEFAKDSFTKSAVSNGIKKITLSNTKNNYYTTDWATVTLPEVNLEWDLWTNVDRLEERTTTLKTAIEKSL